MLGWCGTRFPSWVFGLLLGLAAVPATAQEYPTGPIKMIVPYAAGGPVDVVGRIIGQYLSERLGKPIVIDNRPGAGTAIGAAAAATSSPDGYTLFLGNAASHAMNPALNKLSYDPVADFEPVSLVASMPFLLLASPTLPVTTVGELVSLAKQRRDFSYASAGSGSSTHLVMELFKQLTGIEALHVPYKARSPAEADVIAGRVSMMFDSTATAVPRVTEGALRGLAVTSLRRLPVLPDLPTVAEATRSDFSADLWVALFAPAKTPAAIVAKLHDGVAAIAQLADMQQRLVALGAVVQTSTPAELASLVRGDLAKWTALIKQAGITTE